MTRAQRYQLELAACKVLLVLAVQTMHQGHFSNPTRTNTAARALLHRVFCFHLPNQDGKGQTLAEACLETSCAQVELVFSFIYLGEALLAF